MFSIWVDCRQRVEVTAGTFVFNRGEICLSNFSRSSLHCATLWPRRQSCQAADFWPLLGKIEPSLQHLRRLNRRAPISTSRLSPSCQPCQGAPRSQQPKRSVFFSFPSPPKIGCPILRAVGEGWDKQNVRGDGLGCRAEASHPSKGTRRMEHPIFGGDGWNVLLREPSKREIRGSGVAEKSL
jgi:hypothetical protein